MEDELLFETPNGSVITESEAKSKYGDRFQGLLDSGTFKQTDKTADKKEEVKIDFDVDSFYISPNGSEIKGIDIVKKYGNRSQFLVDNGTLKKKDPLVSVSDSEAGSLDSSSINDQTELSEPQLISSQQEAEQVIEIKPTEVDENLLIKLNIDKEDYSKWEQETQREETESFKFIKTAFTSDEGEEFFKEKKDSEKILSYKTQQIKGLIAEIANIDSQLTENKEPKDKIKLLGLKSELKKKIKEEAGFIEKIDEELFPTYKKYTSDLDLERRKNLYEAGQIGGTTQFLAEAVETFKTIPTTASNFATGTFAFFTSLLDQGLTSAGADKKGVLAGATEALLDSSEALDIEIGSVRRSGVIDGKRVTVNGKEFIVTDEGDVLDDITHVSVVGILPEEKINKIKERSKGLISETFYDGGALLQSGVQTMANLFALIRSGKIFTSKIGKMGIIDPKKGGGLGMGLASYASTLARTVEEVRADLVKAGLTEDEALGKSVIAGNAIASLDGVFSGLAGANTGIITSLQGIRSQIVDVVKKKGKDFSKKQLKDKIKTLTNENLKEVFIEELPVLFSEKGINLILNEVTDLDVRSSSIKKSEIIETVILTIGATSSLGAPKLIRGNKRSDAIRYIAKEVDNLDQTIEKMVNENQFTSEQGKEVYDEIYAMQTALNRTNGTIINSDNMLEASDLLQQRQNLVAKKEGLEGPLKEDIDKQIQDVDKQIGVLKAEDTLQAREASGETNTENDAFVEQTITVEEVPNIYGPEVVTHKTRSRAAIENWVNGGQIVGRVENLDGFVEGTSSNKSNFQINRDNRQTPNFQQGGIYGNTVKKIEGGYVIISKPGTVDAKNFQPNLNFVNKESSKDSKGVLLPKPNTPARDISNYDIYKVVDGKMIKQNPNNFKTNTDAVQEVKSEEQNEGQPEGELTTTPDGKQSFEGTIQEAPGFITKPSIKEPFILRGLKGGMTSTQINFNEEGKIESVVNKKTGKPVSEKARKRAEKEYLESIIDVNEGQRSQLEEGINPSEINQAIADASNNPKEVAEAIVNEEQLIKEESSEKKTLFDDDKLNPLIGVKFTPESWREVTGLDPSDFGLTKTWISKDGVSLKDGWKDYVGEENVTLEEVVEFMKNNPNAEALNILGGKKVIDKNTLTSLKEKFKKLTGVEATPTNIDTVINIDPNREPLIVAKEQAVVQDQRESAESGVFGKKKGPTTKSITEGKPKKVTVDESKALKDQIKLEVKAAKDSKLDQTKRRKSLSDSIKSLEKLGSITLKKANSLINKVSGVNLNNPRLVSQVLEYVDKVNTDANNAKKFSDADNLSRKIKKLLKSESLDGEVSISAKQFLKIDPALVSDLDLYLENAQKVVDGLTKSKTDKDGNIIVADSVDIKALDKYTSKEISKENKIIRKAEALAFSDLTGLNSNEFTLEEMREILEEGDGDKDIQAKEDKLIAKESIINKGVKKAFNVYQGIVNDIIKNNIDPFTGEKINISKQDKKIIKDFMNIDLDLMNTPKDKLEALDAMVNFVVNQGTGGMVATTKSNEGMKNVIKANKLLKPGKTLKYFGSKAFANTWFRYLGNTPRIMENMFKGTSTARVFNKLSGFDGFRNGVAKAETITNKIAQSYVDKFIKPTGKINAVKGITKTQPNGTDFNTAANDTERGLFAFMRRTVDGTKEEQQNEFERRKGLIEETITTLNDSGETKKSQLIKDAADKILSGSNSVQDIENKVDPINREAVEWMSAEWSQIRPELENVSLNVYNKVLGKDINYTPDSFSLLKNQDSSVDQEIGTPQFQGASQKFYDKKTGVLMDVTRPKALPTGRVVNLGFDSSNISNLKDALTDLETAESIQIMKGFMGTKNKMNPAFKNLVPDVDNRNLLFSKFQNYVNAKRGASEKATEKESIKIMNKLAGIGVSRVLGGPTQIPKQLVPLFNTATNLMFDLGSVGKGISLMTSSPEAREWLSNSGYEIANRGIQSVTNLEGTNTKMDRAAEGKLEQAGNVLLEVQKEYLQRFLVAPDKFAAQASWMAYYMNDLKKQGIDPSNIDWSNHKVNKKAGAFAEQQVGRQQNVSDVDLQGDLFKGKSFGAQFARKTLFPFANFLTNQKTRMYTDINIASSKTATKEDKNSAYRSLAGLGVETATFNLIGLAVTQGLAAISQGITGDDDEEDQQRSFDNRIKGRAGNVVKDILSPIPVLDDQIMFGVNKMIEAISNDEDPFQFFANDEKTFLQQLGVLGIQGQNAVDLIEMVKISTTGSYKDKYGKTREVDPSVKGEVGANAFLYFLYGLGGLPSEAGSIIKYNVKSYKKEKKKDKKGNLREMFPDIYKDIKNMKGSQDVKDIKKQIRDIKKNL